MIARSKVNSRPAAQEPRASHLPAVFDPMFATNIESLNNVTEFHQRLELQAEDNESREAATAPRWAALPQQMRAKPTSMCGTTRAQLAAEAAREAVAEAAAALPTQETLNAHRRSGEAARASGEGGPRRRPQSGTLMGSARVAAWAAEASAAHDSVGVA